MKLFHLSDLHIGKQLNGYSLFKNQETVLMQIVCEAKERHPDVILICGDIYDKSVPSGEAFELFDMFLSRLAEISPQIPVLLIAGNHDSPERLKYAAAFMEREQIFLSVMPPGENEQLKKITLKDACGAVNFYLLPFLKPGYVRALSPGKEGFDNYEKAVKAVLAREELDLRERNVLLSHQFYVAQGQDTQECDSEQGILTVGGLDHIDIAVVEQFDYVALGHLHGAQKIGREHIRYCGTPYKYSVSEANHQKGILQVELKDKGAPLVFTTIPLTGRQDVCRKRGTLREILSSATAENRHDFVSITITDEQEPYHLREQLEEIYDHLLELKIDNERTRSKLTHSGEGITTLKPMAAFEQFFELVRHSKMTAEETRMMNKVIRQMEEDMT